MNAIIIGLIIGAILAGATLQWGFLGFLLMSVFMAIGALVAAALSGKISPKNIYQALVDKRPGSSD